MKRDVSSIENHQRNPRNLRLNKSLKWISRMLSEGDGTPSTKRVCFFFAVTTSIGLCVGLFLRHGAESAAVDLMKWLLTTAGAAYGITRFAEYGKGEPPQ